MTTINNNTLLTTMNYFMIFNLQVYIRYNQNDN